MKAIVRCPYCHNPNSVNVSSWTPFMQIITCDIEDSPGCDKDFAWNYQITLETKVYEIKQVDDLNNIRMAKEFKHE